MNERHLDELLNKYRTSLRNMSTETLAITAMQGDLARLEVNRRRLVNSLEPIRVTTYTPQSEGFRRSAKHAEADQKRGAKKRKTAERGTR